MWVALTIVGLSYSANITHNMAKKTGATVQTITVPLLLFPRES